MRNNFKIWHNNIIFIFVIIENLKVTRKNRIHIRSPIIIIVSSSSGSLEDCWPVPSPSSFALASSRPFILSIAELEDRRSLFGFQVKNGRYVWQWSWAGRYNPRVSGGSGGAGSGKSFSTSLLYTNFIFCVSEVGYSM